VADTDAEFRGGERGGEDRVRVSLYEHQVGSIVKEGTLQPPKRGGGLFPGIPAPRLEVHVRSGEAQLSKNCADNSRS